MSIYYDYYIGYWKNNKIYPYGPYNQAHDFKSIISTSGYRETGLHKEFWKVDAAELSEELMDALYGSCKDDMNIDCLSIYKLDMGDLPTGSYVKRGYFKISEVAEYEADIDAQNPSEIFTYPIDPITYNGMMASELQFGPPTPKKDSFGKEYTPLSAREYMYYSYIDYSCPEYAASVIRSVFHMLYSSYSSDDKELVGEDPEFVVILRTS